MERGGLGTWSVGRPGNTERGGLGTWSVGRPGNEAKDIALVVQ